MKYFMMVTIMFSMSEASVGCFKAIKNTSYMNSLSLNQNIIRVKCDSNNSKINIENKYAKYYIRKGEMINKSNVVEVTPQNVVFKVNDTIEFSTNGKIVEEYSTYVKVQKPNKEIKKYRIK